MTTKIKLKKSSVSGNAPGTSDLEYGELALNFADGKLFYKNSSNQIKSFVDSALVESLISANSVDSSQVLSLVDSDYVAARAPAAGTDSAAVISLIDSAYIQDRQMGVGFALYEYNATNNQTTFEDSDIAGNVLSYSENNILVHYNGILLSTTEYTATDGSSLVLDDGADSGAIVMIASWKEGGQDSASPNSAAYAPPPAAFGWGGARAVFNYGSSSNDVSAGFDYITIASAGNASDFGSMNASSTRSRCATVSSISRGVFAGGAHNTSTMEYISPATLGNGAAFGSLSGNGTNTHDHAGASNGTKGLFAGGFKDGSSSSNVTNTIDQITISTTGNSTDFGDLSVATNALAGASDATRGIWGGGMPSNTNVISYVTFATTGNAQDFGDLTAGRGGVSGTSDTTRSLFAGGINPWPSGGNIIDYVTTQTTGNASDFGDLTIGRDMGGNSAASDGTYAVFIMGGTSSNPYTSNTIDRVTIQTTGNATDFGDGALQGEKGGAVAGAAS